MRTHPVKFNLTQLFRQTSMVAPPSGDYVKSVECLFRNSTSGATVLRLMTKNSLWNFCFSSSACAVETWQRE